jgi:hypothetical protein
MIKIGVTKPYGASPANPAEARRVGRARLPLKLFGNALLRLASSAGAVLIGRYLATLANQGQPVDALLADRRCWRISPTSATVTTSGA